MTIDSSSVFFTSAGDRLQLARAASCFQSLFALDHAWTGAVTEFGGSSAETSQLTSLLATFLGALEDAVGLADWLRFFAGQIGSTDLDTGLSAAAGAFDDDLAADVAELPAMISGSDLLGVIETAVSQLREGLPAQRLELTGQYVSVITGSGADGDLFKNILCSLAALSTAAGLVMTAIPPHVQGPAILAGGVTVIKTLKCNLDQLERVKGWRFGGA